MAQKKKEEEEAIEAAKEEWKESMKHDICPSCGTKTINFPDKWTKLTNCQGFLMLGALVCPNCGILFVPLSIRKMMIEDIRKTIESPSRIVLAG